MTSVSQNSGSSRMSLEYNPCPPSFVKRKTLLYITSTCLTYSILAYSVSCTLYGVFLILYKSEIFLDLNDDWKCFFFNFSLGVYWQNMKSFTIAIWQHSAVFFEGSLVFNVPYWLIFITHGLLLLLIRSSSVVAQFHRCTLLIHSLIENRRLKRFAFKGKHVYNRWHNSDPHDWYEDCFPESVILYCILYIFQASELVPVYSVIATLLFWLGFSLQSVINSSVTIMCFKIRLRNSHSTISSGLYSVCGNYLKCEMPSRQLTYSYLRFEFLLK